MNTMEKKNAARAMTMTAFAKALEDAAAVQFADSSFAVLQEVEGQEIWVEITFKSKSYTPTKVSPAFDPFEVAQAWQEDKAIKAKEKAEKAKEKERKLAAAEAKRKLKEAEQEPETENAGE